MGALDDDLAHALEIAYRTPDMVAQRAAVLDLSDPLPGEDALDVGCGNGALACELAARIGPSGSVTGVDPSPAMLALAADSVPPDGGATVRVRAGDASGLPFPDASFDVLTAVQVYEYVPDMPGALAEAHRVLRAGGRLLVLDTDWDSLVWHSSDVGRMQRILTAWDEHVADPHLPRRLGRLLHDAGFTVTRREVLPMLNVGHDPNTLSAGVIDFVSGFVPGRAGVTEADVTAWRADLESLGPDYFFSLNRYLFLAVR
ncbi:methyltransferase domain-containing protein [Actinomycetospora endophytica]|uniref:Methyltransferase domain-containing protein n=1 Tax=Actinomycetospora endophytica TaxID=2291215 RepID=A0ABS8P1E2_9PSEU|nr:methyltransferase domain-containing protein [Actinomycetospora endophytica]MCD2191914.1 methyltransferase domain-containing protein [Actinomycetospora endophytica]